MGPKANVVSTFVYVYVYVYVSQNGHSTQNFTAENQVFLIMRTCFPVMLIQDTDLFGDEDSTDVCLVFAISYLFFV